MFERYTEQSRRVVFFACFEAHIQPAGKISTGHLLLGLTREVGSRADAVGSLRQNEALIRSRLGIPRPPSGAKPQHTFPGIPLDDDAKKVLAYAAKEADLDGSNPIDTDHILRGILFFPNEAATALQSLSLDLATARFASRAHRAEFPNHRVPFFQFTSRPLYLWVWSAIKLFVAIIIGAILVDVALNLLLALFRWFN